MYQISDPPPKYRTQTRFTLVAFVLLLLSSCTTKIGYNYASWWAKWAMDDYISLDRNQKQQFEKSFQQLHKWHRKTQLPLYADFLNTLKGDLTKQTVDADHIKKRAIETQTLIDTSKAKIIPPLSQLLASLSDRQVEKLLKALKKNSDEYREEYIDSAPEKRLKRRSKSMLNYAKSWLGSVQENQQQLIFQWAQQIQPSAAMELDNQQLWRQQFAEVIALRGTNAEKITRYLNHYLLDGNDQLNDEYRATIQRNQQLTRQLIADLLNSLSDKQRRHLEKELAQLAEDFRELSTDD